MEHRADFGRAGVRPDDKEMMEEDWHTGFAKTLGIRLAGDGIEEGR